MGRRFNEPKFPLGNVGYFRQSADRTFILKPNFIFVFGQVRENRDGPLSFGFSAAIGIFRDQDLRMTSVNS